MRTYTFLLALPIELASLTGPEEDGILIGTVFRPLWKSFLNLIYPLSCLSCKVRLAPLALRPLCTKCWEKIEFLSAKHQLLQHKGSKEPFYCFSQALSVCKYEDTIKECIHLFKYKAKLSLAAPLTNLMIEFAKNSLEMSKIDLILAVPLHSKKKRQRQFNQAQLLAEGLSRAFSKKIEQKVLVKVKSNPPQAQLQKTERWKNVRGTFKVKNTDLIKTKNILLIDDVLTTAATVNECSKMLLEAGANRIDVLTLAKA